MFFSDLVGSTELSTRLDPEEWRDVVAAYQRTAAEVIARFGGSVAKYLGDGVLAYFGYPQAHDEDAERAVRAGLALLEAVRGAVEVPGSAPTADASLIVEHRLAVRIGIHTGLSVIADAGDKADIFGETPNIAARIQSIAAPDTVVITAATLRLVQGLFLVGALGPQSLKGIATPMLAYRVVQPSGVRSRLDIPEGTLTPFVGRHSELGVLLDRWESVQEGAGQTVLITGEGGIGKSRLVHALRERLAEAPHTWLEGRGSPYTQGSAFRPVVELFEQGLNFAPDDSPAQRIAKVQNALPTHRLAGPETVSLFAAFLSIPLAEPYAPPAMSPEMQRRKTIEAVVAWILAISPAQPLLLLVEDLHWCDASTLELLGRIIEQIPTARIMIVLTARPEFAAPWSSRSHVTTIRLNRLTRKQAADMIAAVSAQPLPPPLIEQVLTRAGGNPLYVEELTKTAVETSGDAGSGSQIPFTLQDSLMARLDRLGAAKELAQIASVIGREFSYELLRQLVAGNGRALLPDVEGALAKLTDAELIYARGEPPQALYTFKHALIQEAAYHSLLKEKRKQIHRRVVACFQERFPEVAQLEPEILAHHCTEGDLTKEAIDYWRKAGEQAQRRFANLEAIHHLRQGLALVRVLPETPDRDRQELGLLVALGIPLTAAKGYASAEVGEAYGRAREICHNMGDVAAIFPVLHGLYRYYFVRAELTTALEVGRQLLTLSERLQDRALLLEAQRAVGFSLSFAGESVEARARLERAISLYDPDAHASHISIYGTDPFVASQSNLAAVVLWGQGYPDAARARIREALTRARQLEQPFNLAWTLNYAAVVYQHCGDRETTRQLARECIDLSTKHELPFWLAGGTMMLGWSEAMNSPDESIAHMREGLAASRATGAEAFRPYYLWLLADTYAHVGRIEEGLAVVAEALDVVQRNGERWWEAEIHRVRGELVRQRHRAGAVAGTDDPGAEECFQAAMAVARRQSARSLELRAIMSLVRLPTTPQIQAERRALLADRFGWFREGFDTEDLVSARKLIG